MAFESNGVKALGGGSGAVPGVFTYKTEDTQAVIEGTNYFGEAASFLSLGDIIYISYDTDTIPYVVSNKMLIDPATDAPLVNIQAYDLFAGDTRDTDGAGCRTDKFSSVIQGADGLFSAYTYRNNSDAVADVIVADYFIAAGSFLEEEDLIFAICIDGFQLVRVLTTGVGGVTTEAITLA